MKGQILASYAEKDTGTRSGAGNRGGYFDVGNWDLNLLKLVQILVLISFSFLLLYWFGVDLVPLINTYSFADQKKNSCF